jgi:hypothetical protein
MPALGALGNLGNLGNLTEPPLPPFLETGTITTRSSSCAETVAKVVAKMTAIVRNREQIMLTQVSVYEAWYVEVICVVLA